MSSIRVARTARHGHRISMALAVLLLCFTGVATAAENAAALAFPGAQGWAAHTQGGRGGKLIRVTTLDPVSYTHLDVYKRQTMTKKVTAPTTDAPSRLRMARKI